MVVEKYGQGGTSGRGPNRSEATAGDANKKRESTPRMVPLLSRRSVIVLVIGLVIGILGGLLYYLISPSFKTADSIIEEQGDSTPTMLGTYKGPYESTIQIQIVNPGSSFTLLSDLQRTAQYYAAKANTFPFLDHLSNELEESAPEYSHSTKELEEMITIQYDPSEDVPLIEITTISATVEETLYLTAFVPTVFKSYLTSEEDKLLLQEYDSLVEEIDSVKQSLLNAKSELAELTIEGVSSDIENDSTYISLTATVTSLETELTTQAAQLATLIAIGSQDEDYFDAVAALDQISAALAEAKSELATLRAQHDINYIGQDLDYQISEARVDNLSRELASLTDRITSLLTGNSDETSALEYMVVGVPTTPIPSIDRIRQRDAILLGGILGLGVAWVTLNFKWLANGMPSSNVRRREEEEEEMA